MLKEVCSATRMNIPLTPVRFLRYAEQQYPGKTAIVCGDQKSVDDLLLLQRRSAANIGRYEYDYEVYALDIYMGNLKLFHDSDIIVGQEISRTEMFLVKQCH